MFSFHLSIFGQRWAAGSLFRHLSAKESISLSSSSPAGSGRPYLGSSVLQVKNCCFSTKRNRTMGELSGSLTPTKILPPKHQYQNHPTSLRRWGVVCESCSVRSSLGSSGIDGRTTMEQEWNTTTLRHSELTWFSWRMAVIQV